MAAAVQPSNDATVECYGRTYSRFGLGQRINLAPVDDTEEDRLNDFEEILYQLNNHEYLPEPLQTVYDEPPEIDRVLDCGFGTGAWIDRLLEEHEESVVTGIDIHIAKSDDPNDDGDSGGVEEFERIRWNLNVSLRTSNLRPETFDFINSGGLAGGIDIDRWPRYMRELLGLLRPGGYLQMAEPHYLFQSYAGRADAYPCLAAWWNRYKAFLGRSRKYYDVGPRLIGFLRDAGFEGIQTRVLRAPIGDWDPAMPLGDRIRDNLLAMISSWSLVPLIAIEKLDAAVVQSMIDRIRHETSDRSLKLYYQIHVVYGRRPRNRQR